MMNFNSGLQSGLEIGRGLRRGQQERQYRSALEEIGSIAATGDRQGAAEAAMSQGMFDVAQMVQQIPDYEKQAAAEQTGRLAEIATAIYQMPYEQRVAALQSPQYQQALAGTGVSAEEVASFDPTDGNLNLILSQAGQLQEQLRFNQSYALDDYRAQTGRMNAETARMRAQSPTAGTALPSSVREYQFYDQLSPQDQQRFMNLQRGQYGTFKDESGSYVTNKTTGEVERFVTPEQRGIGQAQQKNAMSANDLEAYYGARSRVDAVTAMNENVQTRGTELIEQSNGGLFGNVGWNAMSKGIPGSSAKNFSARLETLQARAAFQALQDMRDASKTGGALGQITERELSMLQNSMGAMEQAQSEEQFDSEMKRFMDLYDAISQRITDGFDRRYGAGAPAIGATNGAPTQTAPSGQYSPGNPFAKGLQ